MTWIWIGFGMLVVLAGVRYRLRLGVRQGSRTAPRVDDAAIEQIIRRGNMASADEDDPLDMKAAAEAEEEFWAEPWDEPEEYRS